ncbi:DUF2207 domain-containing protein [Aquihabitans sp. G128]|uniref:DUF2207 domain-containing protein n=1 Tax=Aquihabitans sp. G128 TaxID=2849779 RepID=UPI001C2247CA|nr:DUF2207 domain-containing protein [Aquihabitans sp. G128]QXC59141.1 DUF2207 domain-containing protein [Aquihabitans sp. G128]
MKLSGRRNLDRLLIGVGVLVVGGAAAAGAAFGDAERIADTQVHVVVDQGGSARVSEAIDYDFGTSSDRHGIFRDVPGLGSDSNVEVSSDAPDQFTLIGDRIKIGDPDETISGRHRYDIGYTLADVAPGAKLAFNGVGAGWDVPITEATIAVTGPYRWSGLTCDQGSTGRTGGCEATQPEPGRIVVQVSDLGAHEGVTVRATGAEPLAAAPAMPAFHAPPADDSPKAGLPFLVAAAAALVAALVAAPLVRRAGAERVSGASAADAAFPGVLAGGLPPPPGTERRVDASELASMATVEFAPPPGMGAPYGGIVLREAVRPEHKVAWLIEQVTAGAATLDDTTGTSTLTRVDVPGRPTDPILQEAFAGRTSLSLGTYDSSFSEAWTHLGSSLDGWRHQSGLWDRAGDRNRTTALVAGTIATLVGLAGAAIGAYAQVLPVVGVAAVVAIVGFTAAIRSHELLVRTPMGSALWLRIESFRRFLSESEAQHVDWAVEHGVLRQYTAWAVAVGEIDHWQKAVAGSAAAASADPGATHLAYLAPALLVSTASTSTAPSSSGSGGFGGGGVGGGAGGGGGGSW